MSTPIRPPTKISTPTPILPPLRTAIEARFQAALLWQEMSRTRAKKKKRKSRGEELDGESEPQSQALEEHHKVEGTMKMKKEEEEMDNLRSEDRDCEDDHVLSSDMMTDVVQSKAERKRKRKEKVARMSSTICDEEEEFRITEEVEVDARNESGDEGRETRKRKREEKTARKSFNSIEPVDLQEPPFRFDNGDDEEMKKTKSNKKKKKLKQEKLSDESGNAFHAMPKCVEEEVTTNDRIQEYGSTRSKGDCRSANKEALLQTIMKGCVSIGADTTNSTNEQDTGDLSAKPIDETNNIGLSNGSEEVATKQVKPKKPRKLGKRTQETQANGATEISEESLSHIIASIKASSTSKIEALFSHSPTTSATNVDIFHDTPLSERRKNWSIAADGSPTRILPPPRMRTLKESRVDGLLRKKNEMEGWEISPGRFRGRVVSREAEDDAEVDENMAFSSNFISGRPNGVTIFGAKFQVLTLKSREEHRFETDESVGLRLCSVARGKVEVRLGSLRFEIGENGMWRVKPVGERCVVWNKGPDMVIIHVTSMPVV